MAPLPPLQIVRLCDAHLVRGETFSYLDGKPLADSFLAMLADAEHLARALVMVRRPAETVAMWGWRTQRGASSGTGRTSWERMEGTKVAQATATSHRLPALLPR